MKIRIREGNDFDVVWAITRAGQPEDLSTATNMKLTLVVYGLVIEHSLFTVTDNMLYINIPKEVATIKGDYRLVFEYTLPDAGQPDGDLKCKTDVVPFRIVPFTADADDVYTVNTSSDVLLGFKGDKGDDGDDAYQIWLDLGNVGTYEDFIAYLRQPAVDAGASISELEGEIQVSEGLRVSAESERDLAEGTRVQSESERLASEIIRQSNEGNRIENEDTRVQNEAERISKENVRRSNEIDRIEAEGVRVQAESERVQAESEREQAESERVQAESEREQAEATRLQSESERVQAETARANAEGDATKGRVKAENDRVAAEILRNQVFEQKMNEADDKIEEMDETLSTYDGRVTQVESDITQLADNLNQSVNIVNLLDNDVENFQIGFRLGSTNPAYLTAAGANLIAASKGIRVLKDQYYSVYNAKLQSGSPRGVFSPVNQFTSVTPGRINAIWEPIIGGFKTKSPMDGYLAIDFPTTSDGLSINGDVMLVNSERLPEQYLPTGEKIEKYIPAISLRDAIDYELRSWIILSKNIIPPTTEFGVYIRNDGTVGASGSNLTSCSIPLKLKANTSYAISGTGINLSNDFPRAILKVSDSAKTGSLVLFTQIEGGFKFTTGTDELFFSLNVKIQSIGETAVDGTLQLEEGEVVTPYSPYSEKLKTDEKGNNELEYEIDQLKKTSGTVNGVYNIPPANPNAHNKFPLFFDHYIKRDKNINIILVGDSITARDYHTTYFSTDEQTKRPPLMVSKNLGSAVYDKLNWQNTEYARFDRYGTFIETGSFLTITPNALNGISAGDGQTGDDWDDISMRPADTRIYTGTDQASVQFVIPENAYIFNWIYRTDMKGCVSNTVSIAEGNGKVQVYDKSTQTWIEANGYVFSMKHPGEQTHRRNTKFQERLRFRCCDKYKGGSFDGRAGAKTVTISKDTSDSRFLYWGIEWSKEPYILTVINAARGGQSIATMLKWMDDDVFDHINDSPDTFTFVVHEIYLNQGQNTYNSTKSIAQFLSEWEDYFYSDANPYSYREQSKIGEVPWQKFEALTWNPNPTVYGGGIATSEPFGWLTWESVADGMKTVLDNFLCYLYQYRNDYDETGHSIVNVTMALINEAKAKFGAEWYKAFQSSGVTGESFYNDVTHPNDYGVAVISRWINANFDFYFI